MLNSKKIIDELIEELGKICSLSSHTDVVFEKWARRLIRIHFKKLVSVNKYHCPNCLDFKKVKLVKERDQSFADPKIKEYFTSVICVECERIITDYK